MGNSITTTTEESQNSKKKFSLSGMFKRKPNRFIDLLIQQAKLTEDGMVALVGLF